MNRLLSCILPLLTVSATSLASPAAPSGAVLYRANCAACHGAAARGGIGPALNDRAGSPGRAAQWSYTLFSRALSKGLDDHGAAFKAPMPTYGTVGFVGAPHVAPTAAQMKALQAYLKTLK